MNTYSSDTRNAFEGSLNWLREWACSRSYGLGSKMPWDKQFLVESLSDSTIYMAYYTIAHLLHSDIFGHEQGPLGVAAEQMTDEVWDYIFCRTDTFPSAAPLSQDKADALRREFAYFYPMDMRTSGKDLIPNHLSFCIYVHAALFPERFWPRSMRANGHLLLNGKKVRPALLKPRADDADEQVDRQLAHAQRLDQEVRRRRLAHRHCRRGRRHRGRQLRGVRGQCDHPAAQDAHRLVRGTRDCAVSSP